MTMGAWQATIVDGSGNTVPNPTITVQREVPGLPPAACFADKDGATPLGGSFASNDAGGNDDGYVRFYVVGGFYRITATLGAFSRTWRDVPIGTAAGTDASIIPAAVPPGWTFDDATADADPGAGLFRLNHATPASVTAAYVDNLTEGGADVSAWLDTLDDTGNSTLRGVLTIFDPTAPATVFRTYAVSGSVVDGTGYRKLTLAHIAGAGSLVAGTDYQMTFSARGPEGAGDVTGPPGGVSAGQIAVFADGTGKLIEGADLGDSPPTPVEVGEDADLRAAVPGKLVHAGSIEGASAFVGLTDDTTVVVNWDAFINATLVLTTDRILGNPTNGQPGTWRTVYVTSDGGPDTLTFGNQYIGPAIDGDALDDIQASTKAYLLTVLCITTSLFFVAAAPVEL